MASKLNKNGKNIHIAANIARIHLLKMRGVPEFAGLDIGTINTLKDPGSGKDLFFDVKLTGPEREDSGYILVCISRDYPPVITFSSDGPSLVEQLEKKAGERSFVPVFYTAMFVVAEEKSGAYLADYGIYPELPVKKKWGKKELEAPFEKLYPDFKRSFLKYRAVELEHMKPFVSRNWDSIDACFKGDGTVETAGYIDESNVPENDYLAYGAAHNRSIPSFTQIPPRTGVNERRFYSGCGACAWMCLIGYHDNVFTSDVLRGSDLGDSTDRVGYQDKVMMELSKHLGTCWCFGMGSTPEGYMDRGYAFVEDYLGHTCRNTDFTNRRGDAALDIVLKYLDEYKVASVISMPGHALIAYQLLYDQGESEDHYLRVYNGDGSGRGNDPYISFSQLKGAWSMEAIEPRTHVTLPWASPDVPAFADAGDYLAVAFRAENGDIVLATSEDGEQFEIGKRYPGSGKSAPSLINYADKYLYLAWSDEQSDPTRGPLRLKQIAIHNLAETDLPAPRAPDEDADQTPAIAILRRRNYIDRRIYMVWRSKAVYGITNIACTDLDLLGRTGRPWVAQLGDTDGTACWKALQLQILSRPSLVSDLYYLYLGYKRQAREGDEYTDDGLVSRVARMDYQGTVIENEYPDFTSLEGKSGCSLTAFRFVRVEGGEKEILPFSYDPAGSREYEYRFYSTDTGVIEHTWLRSVWIEDDSSDTGSRSLINHLKSEEIHWPPGISGKQGVVLGTFVGMTIGPCLFSAWNDENGRINIRYHSIDDMFFRIPDEGWPLEDAAWPDEMF
ncbi:MAG: hypothetical protein JXA25_19975 [Anaerolineales bacterium]|nr:hypothetical protein [Anaerolineales bacterium]